MDEMRLLTVALAGVLFASVATAGSTLHIGFGPDQACATGCAGDPNVSPGAVGSAEFDIYQNSGGALTALQPVLMIIGVPNANVVISPANYNLPNKASLFSNSSIADVSSTDPYPGGTFTDYGNASSGPKLAQTYGTPANLFGIINPAVAGTGYYGDMTSGDVYSFLHLSGANNSNSYTNWKGYEDTHPYGYGPTQSFSIYAFSLYATLSGDGMINVAFDNSLTVPHGSIIVGYAEAKGSNKTVIYDTPWTEAGLQAPEPTLSALVAAAFAALILAAHRKRLNGQRAS